MNPSLTLHVYLTKETKVRNQPAIVTRLGDIQGTSVVIKHTVCLNRPMSVHPI